MIQRQIDKFPEARSVEIIPIVKEGKPHKEIMITQAEKHVDLIIIAKHRDKEFPYIHFRSITEKIKRRAQCSVLVVGV
jgi:nucleotide-binding universal stress UspA family protein